MVKPDIKHNYYADLELPVTASVDDVRKAYRKLALLYHPDRNAGREGECIPKFQAIQAANEVLSDPTQKARYDNDRRKAGLFVPTVPRQSGPGNPYAANSPFPPPPRRTQPGSYQRPQSSYNASNGADRFTNFPRPSPTARKDPAQDRTNMFRAWQNMNNAQERQRNFTAPGQQPQGQPQPSATRPRPPQPPPRQEPNMTTEERIRAGMNYRKAPPNVFDMDGAESRKSAWASFQSANSSKPGVSRNNTSKTPKKQGFDPNTPGSDERAAPRAGSHYVQRHKSADFGRPSPKVPPPPPGPPPSTTPSSPMSRESPTNHRPPLRARTFDDQVPFSEGNRERTPYTSFIGEKTEFSAEQLRRSYSTRDTSKLGSEEAASKDRARSTSPIGRQNATAGSKQKPFVVYSSDESESEDDANRDQHPSDDARTSPQKAQTNSAASTANMNRPKKIPTPPSKRWNGSLNPSSPPPVPPIPNHSNVADPPRPDQDTDATSNMYARSSPSPNNSNTSASRFSHQQWRALMFGSHSTSGASSRTGDVPNWALPSSLSPFLKQPPQSTQVSHSRGREAFVTAADPLFVNATKTEQAAYLQFQTELRHKYTYVPHNFDMDVFFKLISSLRYSGSSGHKVLDVLLNRILVAFPSIGMFKHSKYDRMTNEYHNNRSFTFPRDDGWFSPPKQHRSDENINTNFSNEEWSGTFKGQSDYFTPTESTPRRQAPPNRSKSGYNKASQRSSTLDVSTPTGTPREDGQNRPWGSDGMPRIRVAEPQDAETTFQKEQWEKTFQDSSWTWPSQQPGVIGTPQPQTKTANVHVPPHVAEPDDADAMDIDTPPPAQQEEQPAAGQSPRQKEPRIYSVPLSTWRQQQDEMQHPSGPPSDKPSANTDPSSKDKISATLDDLRNIEPIAQGTEQGGLKDLGDLSASLPFQSQASTNAISEPRALKLPDIPKAPESPARLTKATWPAYIEKFSAYLKAYHAFNSAMLDHFTAREKDLGENVLAGTGFLEASGDTSGVLKNRTGYLTYSQAVLQDAKVREAWNLGCERHTEAVKKFAGVREQVRRLAVSGGLAES